LQPKWSNRFEIKPGRWVFVPTPEARADGLLIKQGLEAKWVAPDYYYHLRKGGHVAALRAHVSNSNFLHLDIQDFFGSINRTRITRCLKSLVGYPIARRWAIDSTLRHPVEKKRMIVPYGFVQSQLVASICFFESALGRYLHRLSKRTGVAVSVYVDDVIVSTRDTVLINVLHNEVLTAATRARLGLNPTKSIGPAAEISAFNIVLSELSMSIHPERLKAFSVALASGASESQRQGILGYVESVCPTQLGAL
jgi:hypothetical protein